ncbi:MAG: DegT/DnrJ/EryC1/StrS family aminotransferase, partial [Candidatus Omnitrophota bacterium]|nr:DegT/DnrJ/EryC1/StrS family aminotransferase [Candidatus Omnitrophota bacterium]
HAIGSSLRGNAAGSTGIAAVYSLFMTKPLTCGEGGIVIARDKKLIESIKIIRNYGKDQNGRHVCKGFNYKLSEFDAAVALWAIKNAGYIITERQRQAALYDELLSNLGGASIFKIPKVSCSYYKYILILKDKINRDRLKRVLLNDYGIEVAGGVYDTLCHQEPYFQSVGSKVLNYKEIFPHSEEFSKRQVCLPLYLGLKKSGQKYVAESVFRALKKCGIPIKNQALLT